VAGCSLRCYTSPWDHAAKMSQKLTRNCSVVVYTNHFHALSNTSSPLLHQPDLNATDLYQTAVCFVAYVIGDTTDKITKHGAWRVVPVGVKSDSRVFENLRKASKVTKLQPGKLFNNNVDYAVYVDAKLKLKIAVQHLIDITSTINAKSKYPQCQVFLGVCKHPLQRSIISEGAAILWKRKKRPGITSMPSEIRKQIHLYGKAFREDLKGSPQYMADTAILVHDLRIQSGDHFRCQWLSEFLRFSDRDQLSFPYVVAKGMKSSSLDFQGEQDRHGLLLHVGHATPSNHACIKMFATRLHWQRSTSLAELVGSAGSPLSVYCKPSKCIH